MRVRLLIPSLLTVLLTGCGGRASFLDPKGPIAGAQHDLFFKVIGLMMIVIIPVLVLTPWFAWRYRRNNRNREYRPKWDFSWPLELAIWGIPVLVVVVLAVNLWTKTVDLDPYKPVAGNQAPLEVQVIGLNWKWLFIYPKQNVGVVDELVFPAGRPLRLKLTSDTVMQSFFIPSLGSQIYAMAGMQTQLNLKADQVGSFRGENTQFNGVGFHRQQFLAKAVSTNEFQHWLAKVRAGHRELDHDSYEKLAKPSVIVSPIRYASVTPGLYASVISKYRAGNAAKPAPSSGGGK